MIVAFAFLVGTMAGAWGVQRLTGNSGWIDTIWSFSVGLASLLALWLAPGETVPRWAVAGLILIWSLRLGGHILARTAQTRDDPRYAALMAQWGQAAALRLFLFLQVQAMAGAVLVYTVMLAGTGGYSLLGFVLFGLLALCALMGEAISDAQLAACKRRRPASGICDQGLWAYSRHPNYFFEWLFWTAIAGLALAGARDATALFAVAAPVMMYVLLRHASGVPHVEAHMRRTRPEAFAQYAVRVPVFFPRLWRT